MPSTAATQACSEAAAALADAEALLAEREREAEAAEATLRHGARDGAARARPLRCGGARISARSRPRRERSPSCSTLEKTERFPPLIDSLEVTPGYEKALGGGARRRSRRFARCADAPAYWGPSQSGDGDPALPVGAEPLVGFVEGRRT